MKHRTPPLRYWRFKGEECSPWELEIRRCYRMWKDHDPLGWPTLVQRRKRAMIHLEKIAKYYKIDLSAGGS